MNHDEIFKLDLISLEHLSSISIAVSLWERPDVKEKIDDNFCGGVINFKYDPNQLNEEEKLNGSSVKGQKAVDYVLELLDRTRIPDHMLPDIQMLAVKISQKIYYWRQYVTEVLKLDMNYAEKIFWTSYGQIDELRIVQEFWLNDTNLPKAECKCFMGTNDGLYCLASAYGQEDFAKNHLEHMKNRVLSHLTAPYRKQKWTAYAIMATWNYFCSNEKKSPAIKHFKSFPMPVNKLPACDIFWLCMHKGNEFGAKYFWNKLKKKEKSKLIIQAAEESLALRDYSYHKINRGGYWTKFYGAAFMKEAGIKLLLFFMGEMTEIQKTEFLSKNFLIIFKLFFQIWPYQEICDKMLFQMWDYLSSLDQMDLFNLIFSNVTSRREFLPDYYTPEDFHERIFQKLMKKCSKGLKLLLLTPDGRQGLRQFYKQFDIDHLKLIINDVDLKDHKNDMLNMGLEYLKKYLQEGNYEIVNKFIKDLNLSHEEVKSLKQNLNFLHDLLIKGDLTAAEEHLNWLGDSDDERDLIKNQLNAVDINFFLIQNCKFESAHKFLSWMFSAEEDREKLRELLKTKEFLMSKFFEVWSISNDDTNICAEKCSKLLNWYFESDEKIAEFKKLEVIQDKFLIQKYWDALCHVRTLKNFDEFLKFCLMTPEEIEIMKINIANNITWWIETYALLKPQYFGMMNELLKWVYRENKAEKRRAIKNYLNSPRGCLLCLRIFKNFTKKSPLDILKFFNSWVKPTLNFKNLYSYLTLCDDSVIGQNLKTSVKKLLKVRKSNRLIEERELSDFIKYPIFCKNRHYDDVCRNGHGDEEEESGEDEDEVVEEDKEDNFDSTDSEDD